MDYIIISKTERLLMRETLGLLGWTHKRNHRTARRNCNHRKDADFSHLIEIGYAKKGSNGGYYLTADGIAFVESDIGAKVIFKQEGVS